jgi:hypothetical protein
MPFARSLVATETRRAFRLKTPWSSQAESTATNAELLTRCAGLSAAQRAAGVDPFNHPSASCAIEIRLPRILVRIRSPRRAPLGQSSPMRSGADRPRLANRLE